MVAAQASERTDGFGITPPGFRLPEATHVGTVRLQVSDLDGKHMRTIAAYPSPPTGPATRASALQWTPDGKKISFARNGSLYTIPAE